MCRDRIRGPTGAARLLFGIRVPYLRIVQSILPLQVLGDVRRGLEFDVVAFRLPAVNDGQGGFIRNEFALQFFPDFRIFLFKNLSRSSRISFCLAASSRARRSLICLFHRSGKESNPGGSVPKGTFGCQPTPWDWEESLQPDPAASRRDSITEERVERRRVDSLSIRNGKAGVFLFISGEFLGSKASRTASPIKVTSRRVITRAEKAEVTTQLAERSASPSLSRRPQLAYVSGRPKPR